MRVETMIQQVYQALEQRGTDCPLEEVGALCPHLTWNEVFLAIDYLSRNGQVRMTADYGRTYRVEAIHAPAVPA
jgi:hypothetical protein